MDRRKLGSQGLEVSAQGLGCMGMTWAYGRGDEESGLATIHPQRSVLSPCDLVRLLMLIIAGEICTPDGGRNSASSFSGLCERCRANCSEIRRWIPCQACHLRLFSVDRSPRNYEHV